jgi:hypothetical protein
MKNTPATPLPWRHTEAPEYGHYDRAHVVSDHFNNGGVVSGQGSISAGGICGPDGSRTLSTQNAAYIAHTANAYPKLVEALREVRLIAEAVDRPGDDAVPSAYRAKTLADAVEVANALLAEIGE